MCFGSLQQLDPLTPGGAEEGTSTFVIGRSIINGPLSIAMLVYQRVLQGKLTCNIDVKNSWGKPCGK